MPIQIKIREFFLRSPILECTLNSLKFQQTTVKKKSTKKVSKSRINFSSTRTILHREKNLVNTAFSPRDSYTDFYSCFHTNVKCTRLNTHSCNRDVNIHSENNSRY